jgi:hypothetical protein
MNNAGGTAGAEVFKGLGKLGNLIREFDSLNREVQSAAQSNNSGYMLDTLEKALKELPRISARLQSFREKTDEEKGACAILMEGLNSYAQACEFYRDSLVMDDTEHYRRARTYMGDAARLLKEAMTLLRQISSK